MTSSVSCSIERCASKLPLMVGRVNWKGIVELSVTMPSYGPPRLPFADISGGVFNPTARPFALAGLMLADNALPGKLAIARLSFPVFASRSQGINKCAPWNRCR